jgi:hypothetical protein
MAYATLEILANRLRDDMDRCCAGRPARLRERLGQLLAVLVTAEPPEALVELADSGRARGMTTHLAALVAHLQNRSRLPEALCARYRYKLSQPAAMRRYRVSRRAWDYFHDLAAELDWPPALHVPLVAYDRYPWHDGLEEALVEMEVILDTIALEDMLIGALEAYLSPRKPRRKGYEVYGINLGMIREVPRSHRRDGVVLTRYVSVMRSQAQLSADARYGSVEPNTRSLDAILQATGALYPQYQAVGDFHSHPYDDFALLDEQKGWTYTPGDEQSNIDLAQILAEAGHRSAVVFVIGIARSGQRVSLGHYRGMRNTLQTTLGNCRAIIAAYRSLGSGRLTPSNTRLRLSGAVG